MMPYFSVIIPLFNKENFIESTISSVLNQSFQDFEIIVVNDCSTDNSLKKVEIIQSDKIKIVEHHQNKGLSEARNTGIKKASANYVALLDADDCWKVNYLEKIYQLIHQFPEASLFATNYFEIYPNDLKLTPKTQLKSVKNDLIIDDFFKSNLSQTIYCPSSFCIKKNVFEKVGYFGSEIEIGEDLDFNIKSNYYFRLAYSQTPLVEYTCFAENQITHSSILNKTIIDFNVYEDWTKSNSDLKKYLDFNRYIIAKRFKLENDFINFNKFKSEIDKDNKISGLNYKQIILLHSPVFILKTVIFFKKIFLKFGYKPTTYF